MFAIKLASIFQKFSNAIECALQMVGIEFFNVTIATDDHNEDSISVMQLKARILECN